MNVIAKEVHPYQAPLLQPEPQDQALMAIISRAASDPSFDVEKLTKLLELQERWQATQARKEYVAAMSAFKADPPKIVKNKHVAFGNTAYNHATLDEVCDKIGAALSKHGLSHRWSVEQADKITVTCTITHVAGHSESTTLTSGADTSGQKNAIQAIASAVTYLQRYTLLAATGLSTSEMQDDDGQGAEYITEKQSADIRALLTEVNSNESSFLRTIKADSIETIRAAAFNTVVGVLQAKRRSAK